MLSTFSYCKPQLYYYFCECNQWSMELRSSGQTSRKGIAIGKAPKGKILAVLLFLLFITTLVYAWLKLHQTAYVNWAVIYIWTVWRTNQLAVNFDYGVIYLSQFLCHIIHSRYSGFNSGMYCMKTLAFRGHCILQNWIAINDFCGIDRFTLQSSPTFTNIFLNEIQHSSFCSINSAQIYCSLSH